MVCTLSHDLRGGLRSATAAGPLVTNIQAAIALAGASALGNVITPLADGSMKFVPDILVASGSKGGGALDGLAATAMRYLGGNGGKSLPGGQSSETKSSGPPIAPIAPIAPTT
jgi:hypothetical protein